jgi:hypothetical protein
MKQRRDILWSVSGHGGNGPVEPEPSPPLPEEIIQKRAEVRRAEAEYFCKESELRELITRMEKGGRDG